MPIFLSCVRRSDPGRWPAHAAMTVYQAGKSQYRGFFKTRRHYLQSDRQSIPRQPRRRTRRRQADQSDEKCRRNPVDIVLEFSAVKPVGKTHLNGKRLHRRGGRQQIVEPLEQRSETMVHVLPLRLRRGKVLRIKFQTGFDVASQSFSKLLKLSQARKLLADHPQAAPRLIRLAPVTGIELDFLDLGASIAEGERGAPADLVDFDVNTDTGDIGDVGDAQVLGIVAAVEVCERAL